ncbi:hypothetical protein EHP00_58 [Ecytonucleospora hepatopenaei]|uniref:Uncharacterized protein n=1 Tax=Ecytonucleospora hepatopenaei TaxID=646526 RepID=A0A1W0E5T4_9MICR|nr:hypothetical protein EHP00_58 [Ecytonucleospora hepatopenaei]
MHNILKENIGFYMKNTIFIQKLNPDKMKQDKIYNSPSTRNANTPIKKILLKSNNKLSIFLKQLNFNANTNDKQHKIKEKNTDFEDICKGIENIKF